MSNSVRSEQWILAFNFQDAHAYLRNVGVPPRFPAPARGTIFISHTSKTSEILTLFLSFDQCYEK